jgi:hypothetical protein
MQFQRVYPQGPSQPITSNLRKDERTTDEINDLSSLATEQKPVVVGDTVPIIFCSVSGDGGVWVAPPVVRWGFQNSLDDVSACFALSMGEGPIGSVSASDVYKGDQTGSAVIKSVSLTYGALGNVCSFSNSVSQTYSDKTETFIGATGSSGCPVTQTSSTTKRAEGSSELSYSSKTDTCVSLTATISGTYQLIGTGSGMDGYPAYISGKSHSSDPRYDYSVISQRYYQSTPRSQVVTWSRTYEYEENTDWLGQGVGRRSVVFGSPYRGASNIYPANETFGSSATQSNIDSKLSQAYSSANTAVEQLPIAPYTAARDAKYIGSGTQLAVLQDAFSVSVTETTRTFYDMPEVPRSNGSGGSFAGLSVLNVSTTSKVETGGYRHQVYAYVRQGLQVSRYLGGTGSSSMLADLFRYLLGRNNLVPSALIDTDSLLLSAQFNNAEGLHFNGIVGSATNFRDYFQRIAPFFLLTYTQIYGKPGLRPILPINPGSKQLDLTPATIRFAFTSQQILEGSLEYEYRPLEERKPFCAVMLWREQPAVKPGIERATEVRYSGQAVDGPYEQYDMTEFCTSQAHALKVGKYLLAMRRHSTHVVRFSVAGSAAVMGLRPGDYVTVSDAATPSIGGVITKTETYVLTELREETSGAISVMAEHSPVDAGGVSLISKDMLSSGYQSS